MDEIALKRELVFLGIDEQTWPVLALLPVVQVAWADGEIQPAERSLILDFAVSHYGLGEEGLRILENWLQHTPSQGYLLRGREALRLLAGNDPDLAEVNDVISQAEAVAKAAGGIFGFRTVDERERQVITELVDALSMPAQSTWDWADTEALGVQFDADGEEVIETLEADYSEDDLSKPLLMIDFHPLDPSELSGSAIVRTDIDELPKFPLPRSGLTIGRTRANDITVAGDPLMSRHHCRFLMREGRWYIQDNASANGVIVNGERVTERRLFGSEELGIGSITFRFDA